MAKMVREKYDSQVKPYIKDIEQWLHEGTTEAVICHKLGVSHQSWINYKDKYSELFEAVKRGRMNLILDLKSSLYKRAMGFHEEESEGRREKGADGKDKLVVTKVVRKYYPPDVAAINLALKNLDRGNDIDRAWSNDPEMADLRREELELKRLEVQSPEGEIIPMPLAPIKESDKPKQISIKKLKNAAG